MVTVGVLLGAVYMEGSQRLGKSYKRELAKTDERNSHAKPNPKPETKAHDGKFEGMHAQDCFTFSAVLRGCFFNLHLKIGVFCRTLRRKLEDIALALVPTSQLLLFESVSFSQGVCVPEPLRAVMDSKDYPG